MKGRDIMFQSLCDLLKLLWFTHCMWGWPAAGWRTTSIFGGGFPRSMAFPGTGDCNVAENPLDYVIAHRLAPHLVLVLQSFYRSCSLTKAHGRFVCVRSYALRTSGKCFRKGRGFTECGVGIHLTRAIAFCMPSTRHTVTSSLRPELDAA